MARPFAHVTFDEDTRARLTELLRGRYPRRVHDAIERLEGAASDFDFLRRAAPSLAKTRATVVRVRKSALQFRRDLLELDARSRAYVAEALLQSGLPVDSLLQLLFFLQRVAGAERAVRRRMGGGRPRQSHRLTLATEVVRALDQQEVDATARPDGTLHEVLELVFATLDLEMPEGSDLLKQAIEKARARS